MSMSVMTRYHQLHVARQDILVALEKLFGDSLSNRQRIDYYHEYFAPLDADERVKLMGAIYGLKKALDTHAWLKAELQNA